MRDVTPIGRATGSLPACGTDTSAGDRFWTSPATLLVLLGAVAVFFVGLGAPAYETRDVSRYAQMVLEMRHGHTLVPTLDGYPYYEAAPLAAWAPYASAWALGELSPFAVRLPSALAVLATCVLVLALGRRCSPRAGQIAAAALVLNEVALRYGRGSRIEALLGFAVAGAVVAFFAGTHASSTGRRLGLYVLAGACVALSIAAKGPAGAVLIGAALVPFLLHERRWRALVVGGTVSAVVAIGLTASWLLPYLRYMGPAESEAFYRQFFLMETVAKVTNGYGKAQPFWAYAAEIVPKLAPWSLLALVALWRILRRPGEARDVERLCASWFLFPILLLSAASGKHIRYVVPMLPAFAVLAGVEMDRWLGVLEARRSRALDASLAAVGVVLAACGVAAPVVLAKLYGPGFYAVATGLIALVAGLVALRSARQGLSMRALGSLYAGAVAGLLFYYDAVLPLPVVADRESYCRLAESVAPHLRPSDESLWVVEPAEPERAVVCSQLSLHLADRWLEAAEPERLPHDGVILAPEPLPGCAVRARMSWQRSRRAPFEAWYLLEAPSAAAHPVEDDRAAHGAADRSTARRAGG